MLERSDIEKFTADKQELQLILEELFKEMMDEFNLAAFLVDPRGYTRAFLEEAVASSLSALVPDAWKLGTQLADKAGA